MNKELFGFFLLFVALFVSALYYTNSIQGPIISALNYLKSGYHSSTEFVQNSIDKHVFQADTIASLKDELHNYENNHLVMQQMASEINDLFKASKSELSTDPKVQLVRTLSYQKFGDLNRVWLDIEDYNASKIYGLTYNEQVAGIVVSHNKKPLGLLNRDIQSSYSVYVGKELAPGIAHGNNAKFLVIKFIPAWFKVEEGDEVITSGLDEIFFKGLKVGRVISVSKSQGYQNALVEPYYESNDPNYFYMIRQLR